jgi:membrane protein required for colicin V production
MKMNWLDIVIAIVLVVSIIMGIKTGLIKVVLYMAGLILGIFLAGQFYQSFGDIMTFLPDTAASILAYIVILVVVLVVAIILGAVLSKIISGIALGWLNRLGGAIIGLVTGGLFIGAILAIWAKYAGGTGLIYESALAGILLDWIPAVFAFLPDEFDMIRAFFE